MRTAKDSLRERYDEYARSFIDQGMEPVTFDRWLLQIAADREMWERHQSGSLRLDSLAALASVSLALVPVTLAVTFVARLAGAVAGVA